MKKEPNNQHNHNQHKHNQTKLIIWMVLMCCFIAIAIEVFEHIGIYRQYDIMVDCGYTVYMDGQKVEPDDVKFGEVISSEVTCNDEIKAVFLKQK